MAKKTKKQKARERAKKEANEDKKKSSKKSSKSSSSDKLKKEFKDAGVWDTYQNLSPEQQEFIEYNYKIGKSDSKEDIKLYQEALKEATKQADPYWKSYLLVTQDYYQRAVEDVEKTTQSEVEKNQRLIDELKTNLESNKEYLTLEQKSDLTNLTRQYEVDQEQLIGGAAESGLTFSTKRKIAEQRLSESQTGMVESTQRKYNKQISDLTVQAESGSLEAKKQIEELQRKLSSDITSIGREAEAKLGSENLPSISGYSAMGNVSGKLYEEKTKDIAERQQAIFDEKSMGSLNLSSL